MENYCFPHAFDENGYPRIERELSPTDYDAYRKATDELTKSLHNLEDIQDLYDRSERAVIDLNFAKKNMAILNSSLILQNSPICESISYPIVGKTDSETLRTHGTFQIITYAVLDYFHKKESLENLAQIAAYGGWHHENGTWWHYLDVVCQAYGLKTFRLGNWNDIYDKMTMDEFLVVALLDHKMFPEVRGNSLVLITSIYNGEISFFHPKKGSRKAKCVTDSIGRFARYAKVIWGISK